MYSLRNPKTLTLESDESNTSPQTLSDYDLDIPNSVQNPDNLNAIPHQTSSLLLSMSGTNPVSATTVSSNIKKKLKTPTPFSGKREDLHKFLQEIKIYLLANGDAYPNDLDKVLFVLSYSCLKKVTEHLGFGTMAKSILFLSGGFRYIPECSKFPEFHNIWMKFDQEIRLFLHFHPRVFYLKSFSEFLHLGGQIHAYLKHGTS